jgi:hypothetical protein
MEVFFLQFLEVFPCLLSCITHSLLQDIVIIRCSDFLTKRVVRFPCHVFLSIHIFYHLIFFIVIYIIILLYVPMIVVLHNQFAVPYILLLCASLKQFSPLMLPTFPVREYWPLLWITPLPMLVTIYCCLSLPNSNFSYLLPIIQAFLNNSLLFSQIWILFFCHESVWRKTLQHLEKICTQLSTYQHDPVCTVKQTVEFKKMMHAKYNAYFAPSIFSTHISNLFSTVGTYLIKI